MGRPIAEAFAELEELRKTYPDLLDIGDDTGEAYRPLEWIDDVEQALGIRFPPSYRRFLTRHGGGELGGDEISSVYGPGSVAVGDVVQATKSDWELCDSPRHLILLMDQEGDVKYFLDTSITDGDGEHPVVKWEIESPEAYEPFSENFVEFLVRRMKWMGPSW